MPESRFIKIGGIMGVIATSGRRSGQSLADAAAEADLPIDEGKPISLPLPLVKGLRWLTNAGARENRQH